MTEEFVISVARNSLITALTASMPMLGFGLVVGLIISILQAVTQVHEMTLVFIPKILAVLLAFLVFLPWIMNILLRYTTEIFEKIPLVAS
jgi:flagellar biosynthetic protein FliQ